MSALGAELVAVVPWGDELPARYVDHPQFSFGLPEHTRRVHAPVRLRIDPAGGLHLGGDAAGILHLAGGRTPLAAPVDDFVCLADGSCAVLADGRVRGLDAEGRERWAVGGDVTAVLAAHDRVYVAAEGALTELDAATGRTLRALPRRADAGTPFLGGGQILSVVFDDGRAVEALDLATGAVAQVAGDHHAWLAHPLGADERARLVVWRDGEVARIARDGTLERLGAVDGIAVAGAEVFTGRATDDGVVVAGPDGELRLDAPPGFRLIGADPFRLMGGEAPDSPGELRTYDAGGQLADASPPPHDLAAIDCRVPVPSAWQVDPGGGIVIPVVTPAGVAVVRLRGKRSITAKRGS